MAKRKKPLPTRPRPASIPSAAAVATSAQDIPKTYGETTLLVTAIFGIVGISLARLFLFNELETAKFDFFLRGQTPFELGALLSSSIFWKALFSFAAGATAGYFLARDLPASPRSDIFARRAGIFLAVVLAYVPAMSAGFIWDDDQLVTVNPSLRTWSGLGEIWAGTKSADYFPLTSTLFWIEYHFWQLAAPGYHTVNVLLHAVDTILLGVVLSRLKIPGAWLAALIFGLHPVHAESVAWIAERKNTLSLFFYLLALLSYFKFERTERWQNYVWALVCFIAALLAKTHLVVMPMVLILCAWWRQGISGLRSDAIRTESERRLIKTANTVLGIVGIVAGIAAVGYLLWLTHRYHLNPNDEYVESTHIFRRGGKEVSMPLEFWLLAAICIGSGVVGLTEGVFGQRFNRHLVRSLAFFQIAVLLGVITVWFQYGRAIGAEEIPIGNLFSRLANAGMAVWWYLGKALLPVNLIVIYPVWNTSPPSVSEFIPDVLLVAFMWALWHFRSLITRGPFFAMAYFIVTLLPVLGFLKMSYMRLTLVADHFQYFSDISIVALIATGVVMLYRWLDAGVRPILAGVCALLLAACSAYTWERAGVHQSEETLWRDTLSKNDGSWQAHNHMGAVLFTQGHHLEALHHFSEAVRLKPINPESHNNLGLALATQGKMDEAIAQYREAVRIQDNPAMRINLANALLQTKRFSEAVENYRRALELDMSNAGAHCNLGYALAQTGQLDEAEKELEIALKLDPSLQMVRQNLDLIRRQKAQRGGK